MRGRRTGQGQVASSAGATTAGKSPEAGARQHEQGVAGNERSGAKSRSGNRGRTISTASSAAIDSVPAPGTSGSGSPEQRSKRQKGRESGPQEDSTRIVDQPIINQPKYVAPGAVQEKRQQVAQKPVGQKGVAQKEGQKSRNPIFTGDFGTASPANCEGVAAGSGTVSEGGNVQELGDVVSPVPTSPAPVAAGATSPSDTVLMVEQEAVENNLQSALPQPEPLALEAKLLDSLLEEIERNMVDRGMSASEAVDFARRSGMFLLDDFARQSPQGCQWPHLRVLQAKDPARFSAIWSELKNIAHRDIRSGEWGADNVAENGDSPLDRAHYLALLRELSEEWQPRTGIERILLEQMAQAHWLCSRWLKKMCALQMLEDHEANQAARGQLKQGKVRGVPGNPRLTGTQAVDRAFMMSDRFHKMFIRCQRALRDQRRYGISIVNAQQVNVAEQQINVGEVATAPGGNDLRAKAGDSYVLDVVEEEQA